MSALEATVISTSPLLFLCVGFWLGWRFAKVFLSSDGDNKPNDGGP